MKLLVATRNKHKLSEIRAIMAEVGVSLLGVGDLAMELPEIVEDAPTLEGNAAKKALGLCAASGLWTLADDSGLEVRALGGAPGVCSARYAGAHGDDQANNSLLLRNLEGEVDRRARFRCALALAAPSGSLWELSAACNGTITLAPAGEKGFGYDPVFIPSGYSLTFAELPATVKNEISHRARALQAAAREWGALLRG